MSEPISGEQITELERRAKTMRPRPWAWAVTEDRRWAQIDSADPGEAFIAQCPDDDNAALIVAAVNALPLLLSSSAAVQRLEAESDHLRRQLKRAKEVERAEYREMYAAELRTALGDELCAAEAECAEARAALQRVEEMLDEIDDGVHATTGRQFGQGMAHASKLIRDALAPSGETT